MEADPDACYDVIMIGESLARNLTNAEINTGMRAIEVNLGIILVYP